ncbi:MAG: DeoR/GlpR family DNA-binding transcription regulator [Kiritimatiellae bacterium]|nr:DeoR/GlpR family DNA-binding transcription regulator [Kiritimatiellia bacterium]
MRINKLLAILQKKRFHSIDELKKKTGTLHATIHRDLNALAMEGKIRKTYGGVETISEKYSTREYDKRININSDLKMEIARAALKYISPGDHVFLDASSTCYFFGRAIMQSRMKAITIVTNSLHLLAEYRQNDSAVKLVSTGGSVDRELGAFFGLFTTDFIMRIGVAKTFISAAGCTIEGGISTTSEVILGALKAAIAAAPQRYCLVDSTKFGREYLFKVAKLDVFGAIITDGGIGQQLARKIRQAGLPLVING